MSIDRFTVPHTRPFSLCARHLSSLFRLFSVFAFSSGRLRCALAATVFTALHAGAQTLAPVVVTGTREPTPLDRVVGDVVVIDADRIRASGADSLEDLLRREGGIQLSRNGAPGQSAGVLLRGSSASSTLVLIDGVRVGSATLGQTDLSALGLAQIERIEILRGPGSSLYGADAVGGVVQIVTRRGAGEPHVTAHAAAGELRSSALDASVDGAQGRFDYAVSASREASRGISAIKPGDAFGLFNPDRDGYLRRNFQMRGGYALAPEHRVGLSVVENRVDAQFDGAEFPPPTFMQDASPNFRNHLVTRAVALDYRGVLTREWTMSAQASRQLDDLVSGGNEPSRFITRRDQLTWQLAWKPSEGQQWLGAVEQLDETAEATGFPGVPRRRNSALVLGWTGRSGPFKAQVDARHDRNSVFGSVDTGKLGLALEVGAGVTLRAVAGTAFRAPTFNDLYFPGFGVPTIAPERSRSLEAGLQWRDSRSAAALTVYRNRVRDLIAFEPDRSFCPTDPAYDFGCARNIGRATLQGATLTAEHRIGAYDLRAAIDLLDARNDLSGDRLPRRAAHQETLSAARSVGAWSTELAWLRVGARPDSGAQLPAYQVVDLQARWRFTPNWRVEAKLLNAFDHRYEAARDYPALGRQAWLGLRYDGRGL